MQSLLRPHLPSLWKDECPYFFQRPLSDLGYFQILSYLFLSGLTKEWVVNENMLSVIFVFLSKLFYLPKSCLCSYKIGIIILCILGWYDPCEVLGAIPDPFGQEPGCGSGSGSIRLWLCPLRKMQSLGLCPKDNMLNRMSYCTQLERRQDIIQRGPKRSEVKVTKCTQASQSKLILEAERRQQGLSRRSDQDQVEVEQGLDGRLHRCRMKLKDAEMGDHVYQRKVTVGAQSKGIHYVKGRTLVKCSGRLCHCLTLSRAPF